jgi:NodT family efflux transporter outer membrane factor (OMF) lipoprotein
VPATLPCPPPCRASTAPWRTPPPALRGSGVALLAAALLAGGCATLQRPATQAPPAAPPPPATWHAPLPPAVATADAPAELAGWWRRLGDPALAALVEQAWVANTQVAAAQARLLQARAAREAAAAALRPRLALAAGSQWQWTEATASTRETQRIGLEAAWEADLWGRTGAGERAAAAAAQAGALDLDQVRVVVAAEVALALLQWRGAQARAALARRHLALLEQTLQIARWRAEAGLATQLEVEQARNAAERLRAQLPVLASSAAQALHALATLTARPVAALHAELAGADDATAALPALAAAPLPAVPAEVLRRRPDIAAAERRLVAAGARVEQADLQRLPALTLSGTLGLQALGLAALGSGAGVATLAAGLSAPLADGGRLQAQVRQQEGARDEAAAAYRAAVLGALQEVEDALVSIARTGEQLAALHAAADAASAAAALAEQRWRAGLVDFQHVLLAQRSLVEAEDSVAATTVALAGAQVRLVRALGGGGPPPNSEGRGVGPPPNPGAHGSGPPAAGEPAAAPDAPTPAAAAARPAHAAPARR